MNSIDLFSGRTLVVAFEGWNDAGDSASNAARFLIDSMQGVQTAELDSQVYYDFQFARPIAQLDETGNRYFVWPSARLYRPAMPELFDVRILLGVEPSRNWLQFSKELSEIVIDEEIDSVIFLGAMLADVPHTRPIAIAATTTNREVASIDEVELSQYEGPVGILSVLGAEFESRDIPTMSLWASVPHYVHNGPVPKATLALLAKLEDFLGIQFDHKQLPEEAFKWERAVDELAENDEELAEYVSNLERNRDELEVANGDSLAREVEQFLRGKDDEI